MARASLGRAPLVRFLRSPAEERDRKSTRGRLPGPLNAVAETAARKADSRVGLLVALLLASAACQEPPLPGPVRLSFFAVGDTGAPPDESRRYAHQLAVARAVASHDAEREAHALLLLGDNFYNHGLRSDELLTRIRANLVKPWCRFVVLDGPRSTEVADACALPAEARRPLPILVVLGNHDYRSDESPRLQREAVPRFVTNWTLPREVAGVVELADGVSLVLLDSQRVIDGGRAYGLADALRRAAGPWRVLVAHHPLAFADAEKHRDEHAAYSAAVRAAIERSGAPPQLVLSGHKHNLQLLALDAPARGLQVIAGGGSGARSLYDAPTRLTASESRGYARIDQVSGTGGERLVASLYAVSGLLRPIVGERRLVGRASVALDGSLDAD